MGKLITLVCPYFYIKMKTKYFNKNYYYSSYLIEIRKEGEKMDKIKYVKLEQQDGSYSEAIPLAVDASSIDINGSILPEVLEEIEQSIVSVVSKSQKKAYCFNTLIEMKNSTILMNNDIVQTLGYYQANDGGGAIYKVVDNSSLVDNGGNIIELDNGLRAVLSISTGKIYAEQFGIMGNEPNNTNCNEQLTLLLNYASINNLEVNFMKKTYICFSVTVPANTRINGNGCMFKKPNFKIAPYNEEPSKYGRRSIFSLARNTSNEEPLPIVISNCTFDGNCWEIWRVEDEYSQQQGSLITIFGNPSYTSRIHAKFYNVIVQNSASDGFHARDHADVYIENAKSFECFRGGLTCTGGGSLVKVNGFEFNGNLVNDGIDFETDSGNTETNEYFLTNITINNDLDLGVPSDNALVVIDKMLSKGTCIIRGTKKGVHISNSHFKISDPTKHFVFTNSGGRRKNYDFLKLCIWWSHRWKHFSGHYY